MNQHDPLLDHIRRLALQGMGERRTDGQLLEQFISERDESAFALLLRRHGAMVWSVCRRILGNSHDADDAFQAVFLVLVRKADSVRPREAVGNWLYGVAYRTALEARGRIARRRTKERSLQNVPHPASKPDTSCPELWPILDRELSRLADKYRLPIVLCDLEGRSRKEVAQQLAIPEGTLSSRLATARKKLAARLARYGFTVSGLSLAALLAENTATAAIAPSLVMTATKAAVLIAAGPAAAGIVSATVSTLTEGVIKTMFIAKIKTATLVVCSVAALGVGTGGVYYQTRVGAADSQQPDRIVQNNSRNSAEPGKRETDKTNRQGKHLSSPPQPLDAAGDVKNILTDSIWIDLGGQIWTAPDGTKYKVMLAPLIVDQENRIQVAAGQDKRKRTSEPAEREIDKLKQENEVLRRKLRELEDAFSKMRGIQGGVIAGSPDRAPDRKPEPKAALEKLLAETAHIREEFDTRMQELESQRTAIEEKRRALQIDMKERLTKLGEMRAKIQREQGASQSSNRAVGQMQGGGDKLDQILQRLERLEKRLDRLEKGRQ